MFTCSYIKKLEIVRNEVKANVEKSKGKMFRKVNERIFSPQQNVQLTCYSCNFPGHKRKDCNWNGQFQPTPRKW
jgi:rubrerythrin